MLYLKKSYRSIQAHHFNTVYHIGYYPFIDYGYLGGDVSQNLLSFV